MGAPGGMEWLVILVAFGLPIVFIVYLIRQSKKYPNIKVKLQNEQGKIKEVKIGLSWTMLFFSQYFGVIWFMRGLTKLGFFFLFLTIISIVIGQIEIVPLLIISSIASFALTTWSVLKGNEITLKNYLKQGYDFVDDDWDAVKFAKDKWNL